MTGPSARYRPPSRGSNYSGAASIGHGAGYEYPHDHDGGWVAQQYLPDELTDRHWYQPSQHGHEQEIARRMDEHQ